MTYNQFTKITREEAAMAKKL